MTKDEEITELKAENFELRDRLGIIKSEVETIRQIILSIGLKL